MDGLRVAALPAAVTVVRRSMRGPGGDFRGNTLRDPVGEGCGPEDGALDPWTWTPWSRCVAKECRKGWQVTGQPGNRATGQPGNRATDLQLQHQLRHVVLIPVRIGSIAGLQIRHESEAL